MKNRKKCIEYGSNKNIWKRIGETQEKICEICGRPVIYIYKYDAMACISCNKWLDLKCDDETCEFCKFRPDTPYEVCWKEKESPSDGLIRKMWRQDNYQHKEDGRIRHESRYRKEDKE